jgi:uncharacterized protein (TIGR00725 family)
MNPCIGVIGGAQVDNEILALAEAVGRKIAKIGAILICGGKGGVMEAACKGAKAESGVTIGVLPGEDRQEANPYVDIPIVTGMGPARNIIIVRSSQAIIAIDGSFGTLSEISYALQLGVPVVGLKTWEVSDEIHQADSAEQAVEMAFELMGTTSGDK